LVRRAVEEAEKELIAAGVPCSPIMTFEDMQRHPHYQAREVFTEWDDPERGHVKGYNFVPKFTQHPQQMWRPAPGFGEDNRDILAELGYTAEEVQTLVETKTIVLPQPKPA
jgi:L-carnitine CoA-transferase